MVYGNSGPDQKEPSESLAAPTTEGPRAPLIGDLLTLVASLLYAAYQVAYKAYAALPNDPEVAADDMYSPLAVSPDEPADDLDVGPDAAIWSHVHIIDPLPFGLHPNLLTLGIGICTLLVFWVPIPVLHILGIEPFELPHRGITYAAIGGIALSGAIFNAGFMVCPSPSLSSCLHMLMEACRSCSAFGAPWSLLLEACSPSFSSFYRTQSGEGR